MTKQPEYDKIKALSDLINMARKKKLSQIGLTFVAKLPNSLSFGNRTQALIQRPERNVKN